MAVYSNDRQGRELRRVLPKLRFRQMRGCWHMAWEAR